MSARIKNHASRITAAHAAVLMLSLGLLASAYLGTWAFKVELGIIRPCDNMAYFYYSEWDWLDQGLYVLYQPCSKAWPPGVVHHSDRVYPKFEDFAAP